MKSARPQRRAFATVVAVVSILLVGVTIGGLISRIGMESRRTNTEANRAQQEQIIIARSLGPSAGDVILPSELSPQKR